MVYSLIAVASVIVAVVLFLAAVKILADRKWIMGFLRGCTGLAMLLFAMIVLIAAQDVSSFSATNPDASIGTVSFHKKEGNRYLMELNEAGVEVYRAELTGQQWQLWIRTLKWSPIMSAIGFKTGYRFDSIRGRYLELQMDAVAAPEQPPAITRPGLLDMWDLVRRHGALFPVSAYMSTPGFLPIADGAIFEIYLSGSQFSAKPMNDAAMSAMNQW